jgi:hypothetical protein
MALKEFNAKQFLLEKGEWVGLGVALLIAVPVLGIGLMMVLNSPSPASNVAAIEQLTKAADQRINSAKPPDDAEKPPKEVDAVVSYERVDPDQYSTPDLWFVPSSMEDTHRRSPEILPPSDFRVDYVRGGVKGYILDSTGKRVAVIKSKSALVVKDRRTKKLVKLDQRMGALAGGGRGGMVPSPGIPSGGRGFGGPAYGAPGGGAGGGGGMSVPSTSWSDLDKVGNNPDERLEEQIYPVRMVIVTGTFPYRQQMEEFRRALKKRSLDELFGMIGTDEAAWQFLGFKIQRRVLSLDGREKSGWQDYEDTLNGRFAGLFAVASDYEKENPDYYKYEGTLNKGLVMVRPQLERGEYPKIEIDSLKKSLTKLDKEAQGPEVKRPLSELSRKLQKQGTNIWDPLNPFITEEEEEMNKPVQDKPAPPTTESPDKKKDSENDSEMLIPDKALVRFMDVTVEPGNVYEYRIKVRMRNPNYHQKNLAYSALRELKEIEASEWTQVPQVAVPYDISYYAMDEKPGRDAIMQIHRWVDYLLKDPQNENTKTPLGDWTIAEKLPVRRGEYIGRIFETKVPVWNIEKEDWELGVNPRNRLDRKIPVDYTARTSRSLDPALLVDYEGGKEVQDILEVRTLEGRPKSSRVVDTVPVQMLILTSEGKLIVRNQPDDNANEERVARHKAWKDWVSDIENGRRKPKPDDQLMDQFRGGGGKSSN